MPTTQFAFLFPGQGSQSIGMGEETAKSYPIVQKTFDEANEILGYSLSKIAWEGPSSELNDTVNTQPALLVHSVAILRLLNEKFPEIKPDYLAGHSMGEISALVAAKSLPFETALQLAHTRGLLMKQAGQESPGGMAAILGMDITSIEHICNEVSTDSGIVQIANDNCPGQVVISGSNAALENAMKLAKQNGAKKVIRLAVSIAAHSKLMVQAENGFREAIKLANIKDPITPIIGNVNAKPMMDMQSIIQDLKAQLTSRVMWTETIKFIGAQGITNFIEIGSGSVLSGLLKRINRQYVGHQTNTPSKIEKLASLGS
ncbi:MAG TPA: ACP S-malonyltransferase [Anaerolineae bacterium]|nr:ACP S-malonyltransferase [Anaerolineae bacterium]